MGFVGIARDMGFSNSRAATPVIASTAETRSGALRGVLHLGGIIYWDNDTMIWALCTIADSSTASMLAPDPGSGHRIAHPEPGSCEAK